MRFACLALLAALAAGCGKSDPAPGTTGALKVGLVFDVGGRGDRSFNDAAYAGLERAKKELGIEFEYFEPTHADREAGLRKYAEQGAPLVIGVGFAFTDSIAKVSADFPGQHFACVDWDTGSAPKPPANVAALRFREEEGCFLVGAIAGLTTKTGKVGFVGGMEIPLIHKFRAGFAAGVKAVNPSCEVLVAFAGLTPEAFKDPVKGKELARSQYGAGADIIFHASGSTGLGVFEEARARNRERGTVTHFVIGVDADQWEEGGHVLTSMLKRVDVAVFDVVKGTKAGTFPAGVHEFGLKEDGLGYVRDDRNRALIPDTVAQKVDAPKAEILAGRITVPVR